MDPSCVENMLRGLAMCKCTYILRNSIKMSSSQNLKKLNAWKLPELNKIFGIVETWSTLPSATINISALFSFQLHQAIWHFKWQGTTVFFFRYIVKHLSKYYIFLSHLIHYFYLSIQKVDPKRKNIIILSCFFQIFLLMCWFKLFLLHNFLIAVQWFCGESMFYWYILIWPLTHNIFLSCFFLNIFAHLLIQIIFIT